MARFAVRLSIALMAVGVVASAGAQPIQGESKILNASQLLVGNYLMTDNTTFSKDVSRGDPAGLMIDLREQWSLLGQRFGAPVNWSAYNAFSARIENLEVYPVRLVVRFETGPDPRNPNTKEQQLIVIPAGATIQFVYDLNTSAVRASGVRANILPFPTATMKVVAFTPVPLGQIFSWQVYNRGTNRARIRLWDIKALKINTDLTNTVDEFGQSALGTWPGKVGAPLDLSAQRTAEDLDLTLNPGPGELQGSNLLPRQAPSTKWRTVKLPSGKSYLVHPSGKLFWSMGMTTVRYTEGTPITGRQEIFQTLPPRAEASPFYDFIQQGGLSLETVTFTGRNVERKYGSSWRNDYASMATRRLKSWGFNSLGDWIDPAVLSATDIPYTIGLTTNEFPKRLSTSINARTLPDPFDPGFSGWIASRLAQTIAQHNNKAQFIGVYVDGELPWGINTDSRSRYFLGFQTLQASNAQPAKRAFISLLRRRYSSIGRLNRAWGTRFDSWSTVTDPGESVRPAMLADCREFVTSYATAYYRSVATAFTAARCSGLYLGSREGWQTTPEVVAVANKYVDVYSVGIYQRPELVDWTFPGIDKPIIISEFSYGATDRGQWHPGPVATTSQADRAERMKEFYMTSLQTNKVVGAHWFQYGDQHVTGRFDGENFNMGFLSVTDTPYPEMVEASRLIGGNQYAIRGN